MNKTTDPTVDVTIDELFSMTPVGPLGTAMGNNIFGINHRQVASPIPINKDNYGLTFFTRPQLNMSLGNLRNVRIFSPLLTRLPTSYQRVIRCLLDPRQQIGYGENQAVMCPFVDTQQAFIPILTNHLKSISGWKDIEVPTFTAKEGVYKEGYSMVDGITVDYTTYDVTATFRNSRGDPITSLFYYWAHYMANVFEGKLMPYPDYVVDNMLDYNTRIYRLILDETKTKVQRIAACGASFPIAVSMGNIFDYSSDKPYNDSNAEISIPFRCMGTIYNDDILVFEFNKAVQIFNPSMRDGAREASMQRISQDLQSLFNHRGYPRINPQNYALEWYIQKDQYLQKMDAIRLVEKSIGISN